jgi:hypothetical protein
VLGQSIESMELFRRAQLLGAGDVKPLEALITAAGLYWALTAIFTFFQSRLERRVSKGYVRAVAGRDRRKAIVTGAPGAGYGGAAGYGMDAPDGPSLPVGTPHAGGIDRPVVGTPPMPPDEPNASDEDRR